MVSPNSIPSSRNCSPKLGSGSNSGEQLLPICASFAESEGIIVFVSSRRVRFVDRTSESPSIDGFLLGNSINRWIPPRLRRGSSSPVRTHIVVPRVSSRSSFSRPCRTSLSSPHLPWWRCPSPVFPPVAPLSPSLAAVEMASDGGRPHPRAPLPGSGRALCAQPARLSPLVQPRPFPSPSSSMDGSKKMR
jgi:hypothetical protein